jgi:hypothetical protein
MKALAAVVLLLLVLLLSCRCMLLLLEAVRHRLLPPATMQPAGAQSVLQLQLLIAPSVATLLLCQLARTAWAQEQVRRVQVASQQLQQREPQWARAAAQQARSRQVPRSGRGGCQPAAKLTWRQQGQLTRSPHPASPSQQLPAASQVPAAAALRRQQQQEKQPSPVPQMPPTGRLLLHQPLLLLQAAQLDVAAPAARPVFPSCRCTSRAVTAAVAATRMTA